MQDPSIRHPAYLALTDQQLSEIDALCDRFDQELVKGDAPRIEKFLVEAPRCSSRRTAGRTVGHGSGTSHEAR